MGGHHESTILIFNRCVMVGQSSVVVVQFVSWFEVSTRLWGHSLVSQVSHTTKALYPRFRERCIWEAAATQCILKGIRGMHRLILLSRLRWPKVSANCTVLFSSTRKG